MTGRATIRHRVGEAQTTVAPRDQTDAPTKGVGRLRRMLPPSHDPELYELG